MNEAMKKIRAIEKRLFALRYAGSVINYDEATVAPSESYEGRSEALSELSAMSHSLIVDSGLPGLMEEAQRDSLSCQERAELRELRKEYDRICNIPPEEYAGFAKLVSTASSIWTRAKKENNFELFAPYLEQIVETRRRFAALLAPDKAPYDVYLDIFEPGLNTEKCDRFFAELKAGILPLLSAIEASPNKPDCSFLKGPWPVEKQRELSPRLMELIGLDLRHCYAGESEHPFTDGFYHGDARITTHYYEEDILSSVYSVIHEGGHALYESHISPRFFATCLAGGVSMGIHESQSRLFENFIGRSRPFTALLLTELQELFPERLSGIEPEQFYRAVNVCSPGLIRTEADEVSYCLHIMLRYELEKRLMDGSLSVRELPGEWNRLMKEYLGLEVPSDSKGVLQDIHWAGGDLGYFPSYALGTAYAAQFTEAMKKELDFNELLSRGELGPIDSWLSEHIWQYGSEQSPEWLIKNSCGEDFNPSYYISYLKEKYSEIYSL